MASRTFQKPEIKGRAISNGSLEERTGVGLHMFADGALILEPAGWPDGPMSDVFNTLILLEPATVLALARFLDAEHVRDRLLDVRQRLDKSEATRQMLNNIAKWRREGQRRKPQRSEADKAAIAEAWDAILDA
jgi:hypothetical protein